MKMYKSTDKDNTKVYYRKYLSVLEHSNDKRIWFRVRSLNYQNLTSSQLHAIADAIDT